MRLLGAPGAALAAALATNGLWLSRDWQATTPAWYPGALRGWWPPWEPRRLAAEADGTDPVLDLVAGFQRLFVLLVDLAEFAAPAPLQGLASWSASAAAASVRSLGRKGADFHAQFSEVWSRLPEGPPALQEVWASVSQQCGGFVQWAARGPVSAAEGARDHIGAVAASFLERYPQHRPLFRGREPARLLVLVPIVAVALCWEVCMWLRVSAAVAARALGPFSQALRERLRKPHCCSHGRGSGRTADEPEARAGAREEEQNAAEEPEASAGAKEEADVGANLLKMALEEVH